MAEQDIIKSAIQKVIQNMMDKIMERVLITDPFIPEEHRGKKPLYRVSGHPRKKDSL